MNLAPLLLTLVSLLQDPRVVCTRGLANTHVSRYWLSEATSIAAEERRRPYLLAASPDGYATAWSKLKGAKRDGDQLWFYELRCTPPVDGTPMLCGEGGLLLLRGCTSVGDVQLYVS